MAVLKARRGQQGTAGGTVFPELTNGLAVRECVFRESLHPLNLTELLLSAASRTAEPGRALTMHLDRASTLLKCANAPTRDGGGGREFHLC